MLDKYNIYFEGDMDKIKQLIIDYPKHFSRLIQRDDEMKGWVQQNTLLSDSEPFPAQVYSAIHQVTNVCKNGNKKKFKNITDGFGFCGNASSCNCCKNSVSKNVSLSKKQTPEYKIRESNLCREQTSLLKYGVKNNGQLEKAKQSRLALYQDVSKVAEITTRVKQTKLEKHGTSSYNNRKKAETTCIEKYGVRNTWSLSVDKQNPNIQLLKDKVQLTKLFPKFTVVELASMLGVHVQTVYFYLNEHQLREPYKSTFEQEIIYFLNSLGISNILTNQRKIVGKELDIFLPDHDLAIEYNGVFWHHDRVPHITKSYHYDKFKKCEDAGITLFTIFGNSWEEKKEIWKNKIRQKVQQSNVKVFARKTRIVELSSAQTKDILNNNHVQGYCTAKHCYGLEHDGRIVAVMTFSPKRAGIGKQREVGSYELVRYVTSCNVVGGASKLLRHFLRTVQPNVVYSYSDNQYSNGNLYRKLGFELENENKCGYWYFDPAKKKAYHRFNFTKSKLVNQGFDKAKTEYQIMTELGYLRIWDCGSRTWVMTNHTK